MGDEVGIAVRPFVDRLEPVEIAFGIARDDAVLAGEGRVPHDRIEARVLAREDLREDERPVERADRPRRRDVEPLVPALAARALDELADPAERALPLFGRRLREEGRDDRIAEPGEVGHLGLAAPQQVRELDLAELLGERLHRRPVGGEAREPLAHEPVEEAGAVLLGPRPVEVDAFELVEVEAHEAVARPERVVEEGELVVLRERLEPERELGELDRERVPVDPVEAAGGDEPLGVQKLVLVGRDRGRAPVPRPGLDEPGGELPAGLDEERARAHRRVEDRQIEDLFGARLGAEPLQDRP